MPKLLLTSCIMALAVSAALGWGRGSDFAQLPAAFFLWLGMTLLTSGARLRVIKGWYPRRSNAPL